MRSGALVACLGLLPAMPWIAGARAQTSVSLTFDDGIATLDPAAGGTCSTATTADAVTPGMVPEGLRTIWQLGQIEVFDGGPDEIASTADNTLFAVQGIFTP